MASVFSEALGLALGLGFLWPVVCGLWPLFFLKLWVWLLVWVPVACGLLPVASVYAACSSVAASPHSSGSPANGCVPGNTRLRVLPKIYLKATSALQSGASAVSQISAICVNQWFGFLIRGE